MKFGGHYFNPLSYTGGGNVTHRSTQRCRDYVQIHSPIQGGELEDLFVGIKYQQGPTILSLLPAMLPWEAQCSPNTHTYFGLAGFC